EGDHGVEVEPYVLLEPGARGEAGHGREEASRLAQGFGAEEHPADHEDEDGIRVPRGRPQPLEQAAEAEALEHEEAAVIEPPCHEGPGRAVPEAAEEEDEPEVEIRAGGAVTVAPEGDVEIVAEPRGERDVPPAPELRHRLRGVGVVEIFREAEAE